MAGYNYGVPRQRMSPRHDVSSPRRRNDRIRVCVRKRPRTATELRQNDTDIVTVSCPGRVVVNEVKSAIDLSKYLQKVFVLIMHFCNLLSLYCVVIRSLTSL